MHKWIVIVEKHEEEQEHYGFVSRPVISNGEGMIRLAAFDSEFWFPSESVKGIEVKTMAEDGLLEIFEKTDTDDLMGKAIDMSRDENPETALMGRILSGAVLLYKNVRAIEELESDEGGVSGD